MFRLLIGLSVLSLVGCRQGGEAQKDDDIKVDTGNGTLADEDGDGWTTLDGDCDDNNAQVNPGTAEICDGLDNNCDGVADENLGTTWYQDADADGYGDPATAETKCEQPDGSVQDATDCNDADNSIYPGAEESCEDEIDRNCDGSAGFADLDGDGVAACRDCNDNDAAISPNAQEICDAGNVDEDCDNLADDADASVDTSTYTTTYTDADGDGFGDDSTAVTACDGGTVLFGGDCNDADAAYYPSAPETDCADPNDYNCDGATGYSDNDGDGYAACQECDDTVAAVNPGASEQCNLIDDDCDGSVDEDGVGATTWYADLDGDGFGDTATATVACNAPVGYIAAGGDCDDTAAGTYPGADEYCDNVDNNCDGSIDENALNPSLWYVDADGDGYGDPNNTVASCDLPAGATADSTDCDDSNAAISPAGTEFCNGIDDDCDGSIDDSAVDAQSWYTDSDADGYGDDGSVQLSCTQPSGTIAFGGDCDDADSAYNPGAIEADCNDPNDYNCDGVTGFADSDGDGYAACSECNDADPNSYPGATEVCDGQDNDCNGVVDDNATDELTWYLDADNDGFGDPATSVGACTQPAGYLSDSSDCDDSLSNVNPAAPEYCNGQDDNCDGQVDNGAVDQSTWYVDGDSDGYGSGSTQSSCTQPNGYSAISGDCNDGDAAYNPGAVESSCTDPNDYNCDGVTGYVDGDGDGFAACEECDDGNPNIYPGATEVCDGVDNNCDAVVDEPGASGGSTWYADADGDGFGDNANPMSACSAPSGYVATNTDCDDGRAATNPSAAEYCNGIDDDCNGNIDDAAADVSTWYADADGDGYGLSNTTTTSCSQPAGYAAVAGDCNDANTAYNPGATESSCSDPNDYNCDGVVGYTDADNDGYAACLECDDGNPAINPAAIEACDGIDNDCDGSVDEAGATGSSTWYLDSDGDSYGGATTTSSCNQPAGYVANNTDCNDGNGAIYPGAAEVCDSVDNDCDGATDESGGSTWYADADGDNYGSAGSSQVSCSRPAGYVASSSDCNDAVAAINPGAAEICDSLDNNCNGSIDESGGTTWYADADGDNYGTSATSTVSCSQPAGYVSVSTDCNDSVSAINPGATEVCDLLDNDCDGSTDEAGATGGSTWYADADGDSYGSTTVTTTACSAPAGYVGNNIDCDDASATVNPTATDTCDGVDNNCSGYIDDGGLCPCNVHYYNGDAYMFCTSAASWTAARDSCEFYGYYLVSINDSAENTFAVDTAYRWYRGKWWTGGNDVASEGRWTWRGGDTWSYSNWGPGEPNNSGNEDCMQLGRFLDYSWNDEPCGDSFRYVCEAN